MPAYRKKLIEVALPLEAINRESAREKSIRHGHPSTLHLWWARRRVPQGCREADYARRMRAAYPIHPELFERLYNDWGGLDKFQRTRGVLRFMAASIYVLWERNDAGLLILPSSIPLDSPVIEGELVRYLDHNWSAVLANDVDGATSVSLAIDQEVPALGRYSATRRVARSVWMGSAPTYEAGKNPGIDDRRIKLGCAQPGESAGNFGDALRRLADRAMYLYQDGTRYWFSTQPSVARLADDRAAQLDAADVEAEIVKRLKRNEQPRMRGEFAGVHAAPANSGEVGDEPDARLVILGPVYPHASPVSAREPRRNIPYASMLLSASSNSPIVNEISTGVFTSRL